MQLLVYKYNCEWLSRSAISFLVEKNILCLHFLKKTFQCIIKKSSWQPAPYRWALMKFDPNDISSDPQWPMGYALINWIFLQSKKYPAQIIGVRQTKFSSMEKSFSLITTGKDYLNLLWNGLHIIVNIRSKSFYGFFFFLFMNVSYLLNLNKYKIY